ncbi:hypothetical protein ACJMK2_016658, partial [Sinanodonta woodiana]
CAGQPATRCTRQKRLPKYSESKFTICIHITTLLYVNTTDSQSIPYVEGALMLDIGIELGFNINDLIQEVFMGISSRVTLEEWDELSFEIFGTC